MLSSSLFSKLVETELILWPLDSSDFFSFLIRLLIFSSLPLFKIRLNSEFKSHKKSWSMFWYSISFKRDEYFEFWILSSRENSLIESTKKLLIALSFLCPKQSKPLIISIKYSSENSSVLEISNMYLNDSLFSQYLRKLSIIWIIVL